MAKGRTCPACKTHMYAHTEQNQEKGRWVTYVCRSTSCNMKVKEFEEYPR
jgi:hypothetical protein